jgi:hypothetical protein
MRILKKLLMCLVLLFLLSTLQPVGAAIYTTSYAQYGQTYCCAVWVWNSQLGRWDLIEVFWGNPQ